MITERTEHRHFVSKAKVTKSLYCITSGACSCCLRAGKVNRRLGRGPAKEAAPITYLERLCKQAGVGLDGNLEIPPQRWGRVGCRTSTGASVPPEEEGVSRKEGSGGSRELLVLGKKKKKQVSPSSTVLTAALRYDLGQVNFSVK